MTLNTKGTTLTLVQSFQKIKSLLLWSCLHTPDVTIAEKQEKQVKIFPIAILGDSRVEKKNWKK